MTNQYNNIIFMNYSVNVTHSSYPMNGNKD